MCEPVAVQRWRGCISGKESTLDFTRSSSESRVSNFSDPVVFRPTNRQHNGPQSCATVGSSGRGDNTATAAASAPAYPQVRPVTSPLIPVVVVTHEGQSERLNRCLTALHDAGGAGPVIVIDNSERDSAGDVDLEDLLGAVVIRTTNRGYGAAANEGFSEVCERCPGATAIALLNDDVTVTAGWLERLSDALAEGWSVAQPKLLMAASLAADVALVNSVGVALDRHGAGVDIGSGEPDSSVFDGIADIEIFTGGAVLFSRVFLDMTGGFDERFFLYYEDVDLALRGRELGQRYACVPDSIVWHEGGASTSLLGEMTRGLQDRNRLWCAIRFGRPPTIARAVWLSIRRLRRAPQRRALERFGQRISGRATTSVGTDARPPTLGSQCDCPGDGTRRPHRGRQPARLPPFRKRPGNSGPTTPSFARRSRRAGLDLRRRHVQQPAGRGRR